MATNSLLPDNQAPKCEKCGTFASQRDIDGAWWPPCGCGIEHLKFSFAASSPSSLGSPPKWLNPKKLAGDAVQRLADSEPTEDSIEGMERLRGTPQESMFVVNAAELQRVIECTLEDAIYDATPSLGSPPAESLPPEDETEARLNAEHAASRPPELKKLLRTLVRVSQHIGAEFYKKGVPLPKLDAGEDALSISTAQAPVESYVASLLSGTDATPLPEKEETPTCRNCGYPRSEHHVGQGWCIHGMTDEDASTYQPAFPSASEITEAMRKKLEQITQLIYAVEGRCLTHQDHTPQRRALIAAIESCVREQQQEIERLKSQMERRWANAGASQSETELRAELASLKEEQLTAEEAEAVVGIAYRPKDTKWSPQHEAFARGIAKLEKLRLRALSTKGTEE